MSFETLFVPDFSQDPSSLLEIDNETGDTVANHSLGDEVGALDRDNNGNLYAVVGGLVSKYDSDLNLIWEASSTTYSNMTLAVSDGGNIVFGGGGSRVFRINGNTGEVVWSSYDTNIDCYDMSYGGEWLYVQTDADSEDRRYDPSNGSNTEEELVGYNDTSAGILYHDGFIYSTGLEVYDLWQTDSFTEGSTIQDGTYNVRNSTNLEMDHDGLYSGGESGTVAHVDFDGNTQWQVTISGNPRLSAIDVSPDSLWVGSRDGLYKLDKSDGSVLWERTDISLNYYSDYSLGGFPNLDSYGSTNWLVTTNVSGTVVKDGSGVSGAEVSIIDDESDELATTVVSDSNGDWSAVVPDRTLHVVAKYKDVDSKEYNVKSYPYVNEG